ncbi:MAG: response regulator transcription factor [Rhodospirillaceae bacterium]|nr:MAG: response regulator transcription factor [Rhodospirillaceae bacterium]
MRLLVVEDDQQLAEGLVGSLMQSSYEVQLCTTGDAALAACATSTYDLVVLDLTLPDMDGIDVLRRMRAEGMHSPVIILTARDQLSHRVRGLDIGADDYLVKPVALAELEARIRAQLRRARGGGAQLKFGAVEIDELDRHASVNGQRLDLTARELAVLEVLVRRQGRIVGKEQLFDDIYEAESDARTSALEVHISRLRKKLLAQGARVGIRALRGLGYRLERSDG